MREHFAEIAVKSILQIVDLRGDLKIIDIDQIQIIKKEGGSLSDTELINGIIIDKEVVHPMMPKSLKNVKIALIDTPLEIEKTEFDAEIKIQSPDQITRFLEEEENMLKRKVSAIINSGAKVIFCQKGIDDKAQSLLARENIIVIRRVKRSDMEKLSRATKAKIITNLVELTLEDLGASGLVEEKKVGTDNMIFVSECSDPKAVSILIRGGIAHVVDEAERTLNDALCVVRNIVDNPYILGGGGSSEIELSKQLRDFATTIGGREQLAIEAYAYSLEVVPTTLAEMQDL
ncbi:unnamed protein product, partial [marine sediment metagenome]